MNNTTKFETTLKNYLDRRQLVKDYKISRIDNIISMSIILQEDYRSYKKKYKLTNLKTGEVLKYSNMRHISDLLETQYYNIKFCILNKVICNGWKIEKIENNK